MLRSKHRWRVLLCLNSTFCRFKKTCFIIHEYLYLICLIDFTESLFFPNLDLLSCWNSGLIILYYDHESMIIDLRTAPGQPGSVSKFPPFLWVELWVGWVGWVGRGYIEISRYFPALWINRVTLVTKIKLWYSLGYQITFESPKYQKMVCFFASRSLIQFFQYTIPPPAAM